MMRIIALVAFVSLLTAVGAAPQSRGAAPERHATLSGVLLDAANGAAVRRARIEIMSRLSRVGAVMSDDQGRFAVEVPVEAPITARIVKGGYATVTRSFTPLQLRQAEPLLVALDRGGAIVGRAVTAAGEPAGVSVVTVRPAETLPQPPVMPFMPTTPDERGEFRIGGLPAGRYVVDGIATAPTGAFRNNRIEVQVDAGQEVPVELVFEPGMPVSDIVARSGSFQVVTGTVGPATNPDTVSSAGVDAGPGSSIRGVVSSNAGLPLGQATVSVIGPGGVRKSATTDTLGRYVVRGVFPGTYTVEAVRRGYVRAEHGQRGLDLPGTKVVVEAGRDVEDAAIVLPRAGSVSGTVFDEHGEPLQDAGVQLLRVRRSPAGLSAIREQRMLARTDDRGRFKAMNVMPGDYVMSASIPAHLIIGGVRTAYAPVFWPDTGALSAASPLQVRADEEIGGLVLTLRPVPVVRVSGVARNSTDTPFSGIVRLTPARSADTAADGRTFTPDASGEFSFDDVPAGDYVVQAVVSGGSQGTEYAMRTLTVAETGPDALLLRTSPGSSVSGRFVLEGANGGEVMWGYAASALPIDVAWTGGSKSNLGGPISDGEPFRMSALAGPTRLRISSDDENWYLKSMFINGFDAADAVFDFGFDGRDYTDVEVVFSRLGATLTGRTTDERGGAVRDYAVYVFSTDRDKWVSGSRSVRVARAAADGAFLIRSLPPGNYWAVAVDRVDILPPAADAVDPALLETLLPYAASVVVGESETRDVALRLVRR
jgi:protocatechuate 3,4-dioxygenase beta subunit